MFCIYIAFDKKKTSLWKTCTKNLSLSVASHSQIQPTFKTNAFPPNPWISKTDQKKAPHDFTRTSKRWSARLHSATFTQALMAALQLLSVIDCRRSRASFNLVLKMLMFFFTCLFFVVFVSCVWFGVVETFMWENIFGNLKGFFFPVSRIDELSTKLDKTPPWEKVREVTATGLIQHQDVSGPTRNSYTSKIDGTPCSPK